MKLEFDAQTRERLSGIGLRFRGTDPGELIQRAQLANEAFELLHGWMMPQSLSDFSELQEKKLDPDLLQAEYARLWAQHFGRCAAVAAALLHG